MGRQRTSSRSQMPPGNGDGIAQLNEIFPTDVDPFIDLASDELAFSCNDSARGPANSLIVLFQPLTTRLFTKP